MLTMSAPNIRRVVSCFLLYKDRVAVFHRQATMPTFPSHWAVISGSVEDNEKPWECAQRELWEETNLQDLLPCSSLAGMMEYGLYVDVPYPGRKRPGVDTTATQDGSSVQVEDHRRKTDRFPAGSIIRVYPFVVTVNENVYQRLEFRGAEHDQMQWLTIQELRHLTPTVPALATALDHATRGQYLLHHDDDIPPAVRQWAEDRSSGAATLARQAVELLTKTPAADPKMLKMLRPSMVAVTNVLQSIEKGALTPAEALLSLEREASRAIDLAVERIMARIAKPRPQDKLFTIAVFSRSSTLLSILKRVLQQPSMDQIVRVVCSQSTPGDEGLLMAQDLGHVPCFTDDVLIQKVKQGDEIDLILVACDCVMEHEVVNKIGTALLAQAAQEGNCPTVCCSDRWKIWQDAFPPPLEPIFELIPRCMFDEIIVPPPDNSDSSSISS